VRKDGFHGNVIRIIFFLIGVVLDESLTGDT